MRIVWSRVVCPLLAVGFSVVVFAPITRSFFFGDDFCHFFNAMNQGLPTFAVQPWGGHVLLARNALLWPMFRVFGLESWPYFTLTLALHATNVYLVYRLLLRDTGSPAVGCIAAGTWGTLPLHAAALEWLSVQGQVLLSTCFLILLLLLDGGRDRDGVSFGRAAGWGLLAFLASTSFGMGLAVAFTLPVLVWLSGRRVRTTAARFVLWATPLVALATYVAVRALVPSPVGPSVDSTVSPGAALADWRFGLAFAAALLQWGLSALVLGVFGPAFPDPRTIRTVAAGCAVVLGALALVRMQSARRRQVLAVSLVVVLAYLLVAAGRGPFFVHLARFTATRSAMVPRYHYFPTLGLTIAAALAAWTLVPRALHRQRWIGVTAVAAWLAVSAVGFARHPPPINLHEFERRETLAEVGRLRTLAAAAPAGSVVVIPNQPFGPAARVPCEVVGTAGLYLMASRGTDDLDGRVLRFVAPQTASDAAHRTGGRVASLLVPTGQ
jgi:hypothetical protein